MYAAVTIPHARMTFNDWTVISLSKPEVETPILMSMIKIAYPHQMQNSMLHKERTSMSSLRTPVQPTKSKAQSRPHESNNAAQSHRHSSSSQSHPSRTLAATNISPA